MKLLTHEQIFIIKHVIDDDFLRSRFYFTGGTALNSVYLQHRDSEDLDFFSETKFLSEVIFEKLTS